MGITNGDRSRDTYGFATVEARIHSCQRRFEPFAVKTKEIPCSSTIRDQRQYVVKLLDELAGQGACHAYRVDAIGRKHAGQRLSGYADGSGANSHQSFVLRLAGSVLAGIGTESSPTLKHGHAPKPIGSEQLVAAEKLRQIGRNEIEWLYKTDKLFPVRQAPPFACRGATGIAAKSKRSQTVARAIRTRTGLSFLYLACFSRSCR